MSSVRATVRSERWYTVEECVVHQLVIGHGAVLEGANLQTKASQGKRVRAVVSRMLQ